jgi:hypothetical protein
MAGVCRMPPMAVVRKICPAPVEGCGQERESSEQPFLTTLEPLDALVTAAEEPDQP